MPARMHHLFILVNWPIRAVYKRVQAISPIVIAAAGAGKIHENQSCIGPQSEKSEGRMGGTSRKWAACICILIIKVLKETKPTPACALINKWFKPFYM